MSLRKSDLGRSTLEDWINEFYEIYGEKNKRRSASELWLGVVRHVSKVAEEVRKTNLGNTLEEVAYTFCWLLGFVAWCEHSNPETPLHLSKTLDEIVWHKYPRCCPVCTEYKCVCIARKQYIDSLPHERREQIRAENERILAQRRQAAPPSTLVEWREMLGYVFGESHMAMSIGEICFHLLEEIGEVAQEIFVIENLSSKTSAEKHVSDLESELADVFSWMMALVTKVHLHFRTMHEFEEKFTRRKPGKRDLEVTDIIWQAYLHPTKRRMVCQHCGCRPCECKNSDLLEIYVRTS